MSYKDAASIQRGHLAAPPTKAFPAVSIPSWTTLAELPYRDFAVAVISPSRPRVLPDPEALKPPHTNRRPPPVLLLL
jgi:hypothetical protein